MHRGCRAPSGLVLLAGLCLVLGLASCEDSFEPSPPKQTNELPETFLLVQADRLQPQFYKLQLSWLGSDADGRVDHYRWRWTCPSGPGDCPVDTTWVESQALSVLFVLPVPDRTATYVFEIMAVDDDGAADPTPARQSFELFNNPPVVEFETGTLPQKSLPAITFYMDAVDPDTTPASDDFDSRVHVDHYLAWLDGAEADAKIVPFAQGSVTFGIEDFQGRFGQRTVFVQVVDDGTSKSATIQHTWEVESAPEDGILLVDDCRMRTAATSDASYRTVLDQSAAGRYRVLDIAALPRLSGDDLEATLALFDRVIWYTDEDNESSGALELAQEALVELLNGRSGSLFLCSGLVLGSDGAFGEREDEFLALFGIDTLYVAPDSTTNFSYDRRDTIQARVQPGLTEFRLRSLGDIMECFRSLEEASTRSLYFYPESKYVDEQNEFTNPVQYDIGVYHQTGSGARSVYLSFPIGLPINPGENKVEILELFKLAGIVDP